MKKLMQVFEVIGFLFLSLAIATGSSDIWLIPLILGVGGIFLMWYSAKVIDWLDWVEEKERRKKDAQSKNTKRL